MSSFKLLVDSVEQPIDRPSDNEEQKKFFSGKKKQHTVMSFSGFTLGISHLRLLSDRSIINAVYSVICDR
ncbi:transposase family protein [Nostoc sphaeroides CHAB 2801]|uniref:transposase family protein n=1 Tax=Nostoc sphaeroides TaxID=446679 RepID=UPI001E4679C5|nr:transposase family protein [Nostoc sphaeroides]MCC5632809.1 transposase family protein [Nostoc sphaeroides CHAB 2801]